MTSTRTAKATEVLLTSKRKIADARRAQVQELHSEGLNNTEIQQKLGISKNTVRADMLQLGLRANGKGPGVKKPASGRTRSEDTLLTAKRALADWRETLDEFQVAILEMIVEGKKNRDIFHELGVNQAKVDNTVAAAKRRLLRTGRAADLIAAVEARRAQIKALHATGMFSKDIAKKVGVDRNVVYYDLALMGLESNGIGAAWQTPDLFSRNEAKALCKRTERRVIERRLARGLTVAQMAAYDDSDRQYILDQFTYCSVEIPAEESWVLDKFTKVKVPYTPSKHMRRDTSTVRPKDTWKTKASS